MRRGPEPNIFEPNIFEPRRRLNPDPVMRYIMSPLTTQVGSFKYYVGSPERIFPTMLHDILVNSGYEFINGNSLYNNFWLYQVYLQAGGPPMEFDPDDHQPFQKMAAFQLEFGNRIDEIDKSLNSMGSTIERVGNRNVRVYSDEYKRLDKELLEIMERYPGDYIADKSNVEEIFTEVVSGLLDRNRGFLLNVPAQTSKSLLENAVLSDVSDGNERNIELNIVEVGDEDVEVKY